MEQWALSSELHVNLHIVLTKLNGAKAGLEFAFPFSRAQCIGSWKSLDRLDLSKNK